MHDPGAVAPRPEMDDWSVESELGSGSSGTVYVVRHRHTGERAALKVYAEPERLDDAVVGEVEVLREMSHRHIVGLLGTVPTSRGRAILMEYLPGGSVADLVAARGPVGLGEAVTVLAPIAGALAHLHGNGAVHGDVAPGNVLFTAAGMPKLADLGLAVLVGGNPTASGTPGFRAPSTDDDPSASRRLRPGRDVYSLAALAWFMVTGRIAGPTSRRPPLSSLLGGVPRELVELLEDGLSEDEWQRPTAAEFGRRMFSVAKPVPVSLRDAVRTEALAHMVTHVVADGPGTARRRGSLGWARRLRWGTREDDDVWATVAPRHGRAQRSVATAFPVGPGASGEPGGGRSPEPPNLRDACRPAGPRRRIRPGAGGGQAPGRKQGPDDTSSRRLAVLGTLVGVAVLVGVAGVIGSRALSGQPPVSQGVSTLPAGGTPVPPREAETAPSTAGATNTGTANEEGPFARPVPGDPVQAVAVLTARRDAALAAGNPERLGKVHTRRGTSLAPDVETARQMRAASLHYEGLSTTLDAVSVVSGPARDRVDVAVTSTIGPYDVVGADGGIVSRVRRPEVQRLVLRLERATGEWLIAEVFEAPGKASAPGTPTGGGSRGGGS